MNKLLIILTCCSTLGACAGAPAVDKASEPLIDFASIANQIGVRVEPLPETPQPTDPVLAAADTGH